MLIVPGDAFTQSQKLESERVEITTVRGKFPFQIEIADQPQERTIGLMNRSQLDPRGGMLFVFDRPQIIQMWMKNTLISLDMIFVDAKGSVVDVAERTIPHSLAIVASRQNASFVLELAGGMASFIGLQPGDVLKHRLFDSDPD
ncbi:MAG: DUF192 domain-containing protein [Hyphomicrobiales bacterium]|nr:DUF192 domain-containing protein [Hyphomicrobiales bacterium]